MMKRNKMKSSYIIKNAPSEVDKKHKELSQKRVYLLKEDEEAVNRYSDIVCGFVENLDGLFLSLTHDKTFFNNFRKSFYKELDIEQERIRLVTTERRAMKELQVYIEHDKRPLLFMESALEGRSTLPFLEEIKKTYKTLLVIILMSESDENKVAQFVEAGADNFITKPASVNVLIEKIANTLVPPDDIGKKIREGKNKLAKLDFALAYGVARQILEMKPGSPAGLLIMGDALKGLAKRKDALNMYRKAVENAPTYLEPLKKIVELCKEDGDDGCMLEYLMNIDELSPLHPGRKKEIAELHFKEGNIAAAAEYFAKAAILTHEQKLPECVQMSKDYADRVYGQDKAAAEELLVLNVRLCRAYRTKADWSVYDRIGALRSERKDWKGAITAYGAAAELQPKNTSILYNLAVAYIENKDFNNAAQKFERAISISPALYEENLDIAYLMGQVFLRAARHQNAAKVLKHVHSVDPEFKNVKGLLKALMKNASKKKTR